MDHLHTTLAIEQNSSAAADAIIGGRPIPSKIYDKKGVIRKVIDRGLIPDRDLRKMACKWAEKVLIDAGVDDNIIDLVRMVGASSDSPDILRALNVTARECTKDGSALISFMAVRVSDPDIKTSMITVAETAVAYFGTRIRGNDWSEVYNSTWSSFLEDIARKFYS